MGGTFNLRKDYFYYEASPVHTGKYVIKANFDLLPLKNANGSYNIICARIMGLSFSDYLRMCRDEFGAEIVGKGSKYPVPYFKYSEGLTLLVKMLNARTTYIFDRIEKPWEIIEEEDKLIKIYDNGEREEILK